MKRMFVVFLLSVFFLQHPLCVAQEQEPNYALKLCQLLVDGRCMEARDMYEQHHDIIMQHAEKIIKNRIVIDLFYKSFMALFFNKTDTASFYLEKILSNPDYQFQIGTVSSVLFDILLKLYIDKQQFEAGIKLCNGMIDFYKRNPFNFDEKMISNKIHFADSTISSLKRSANNEPLIKLERLSTIKDSVIHLKESHYIRFDAKYNGLQIETWFETNNYYFILTQDLAKKIGVKVINDNQEKKDWMINNVPVKVYEGIIDTVDILNIRIINVPVLVYNDINELHMTETIFDSDSNKSERLFKDKQISMGLAAMKLIGKFELDWNKNTIYFPDEKRESKTDNAYSNIFFVFHSLFTHLKINELYFSGLLESGNNEFINISSSFYEKNKSNFEIDSVMIKKSLKYSSSPTWGGTTLSIPYNYATNANVFFNNKIITHDIREVGIKDIATIFNSLDGNIGSRFLKRLNSKIIIDFDNMEIRILD